MNLLQTVHDLAEKQSYQDDVEARLKRACKDQKKNLAAARRGDSRLDVMTEEDNLEYMRFLLDRVELGERIEEARAVAESFGY